jgi:hypothetical protein
LGGIIFSASLFVLPSEGLKSLKILTSEKKSSSALKI